VFWKAADGLPLDPDELLIFQRHTGRQTAPTAPARECWGIGGRRGGKSENMISRATHRAISTNWRGVLSPGETGVIPVVSPDRDQGRNSLSYLKALAATPLVAPYVRRILRDSVEFKTGATVKVATASWRTTRGYTMVDVLLEECAFYRDESSANPDEEILNAIRPALLTIPGARVYGISTPYAQKGILWKAFDEHWGRDGDDVLVFCADSLSLNPTLNARAIEREFEDDPARAASEYGRDGLVQFRVDVEQLFAPAYVRAVVATGRHELAPVNGVRYYGFVDPSGGSSDSFTLAIAHPTGPLGHVEIEDRRLANAAQAFYLRKAAREALSTTAAVVVDLIREVRAPYDPGGVVAQFAGVLASYRVRQVGGDHYAGEWPREEFSKNGVTYRPSDKTKSELYGELLPIINAGRVELLDHPRLVAQLVGLERHTSRAGRDSIDHAPGGRDDVSNAVAGAVARALTRLGIPEQQPVYWG